ncbi:Aste57867_11456 [Aphanomyces stellatus]|uniref:Aste57867_11456 protein n=1 Tax=Aphanomyces stellatus TaxID=120398 RepID=A0A485KT19_9STRA|nr:hypothetical protein As57867_011413 [Aphanomyces stellatus]VFT88317.1 Aste57867_11456 [Aphanomyces stellatus]
MPPTASFISQLLNPLRELSVDLDLGAELEEYLEVINVDESVLVNFAQAALLVQQSSALYSKKVEDLYTLVLDTLAHLQSTDVRDGALVGAGPASKKQKNAQGRAAARGGVSETTLTMADLSAEATHINWTVRTHVEESKKIDLPPLAPSKSRRNVDKKTNTKTFQASMVLMGSFVSMENDSGESLKLRSCLIDPTTGALFLDENSKGLLDPSGDTLDNPVLGNVVPTILNATGGLVDVFPPRAPLQGSENDQDDPVEFGGGDNGMDYAGDEGSNEPDEIPGLTEEDPPVQPQFSTTTDEVFTATGRMSSVWPHEIAVNDDHLDETDPWALLDAYETKDCVIKPFRKGISYRVRLPKLKAHDTIKDEPIYTPVRNVKFLHRLKQQLLAKPYKLFAEAPTDWPLKEEYTKCFAKVKVQDPKVERMRATSMKSELKDEPQDAAWGDFGGNDDAGMDDDGVDGGGADDFGFDDDGGGDFAHSGDDDDDAANDVPTVKKAPRPEETPLDETDDAMSIARSLDWDDASVSYEELCKRHIEQFMRGTEQYLKETNVSKHVTEWQIKLAPILDAQDQRPPFDIRECGQEIVDQLGETDHTHVVAFEDVVHDRASYEICRIFSAVLHLANDGQVQLDHDIDMDSLRLARPATPATPPTDEVNESVTTHRGQRRRTKTRPGQ